MMPLCTTAIFLFWETCGWEFVSFGSPCVAQRVWPMPSVPGRSAPFFGFCDQILEPALGLFDLQNAVLLHADACGVIAPVFQA